MQTNIKPLWGIQMEGPAGTTALSSKGKVLDPPGSIRFQMWGWWESHWSLQPQCSVLFWHLGRESCKSFSCSSPKNRARNCDLFEVRIYKEQHFPYSYYCCPLESLIHSIGANWRGSLAGFLFLALHLPFSETMPDLILFMYHPVSWRIKMSYLDCFLSLSFSGDTSNLPLYLEVLDLVEEKEHFSIPDVGMSVFTILFSETRQYSDPLKVNIGC